MDSGVVGVVLAAGTSRRTGFPKALATLDGESFVARTVRTLAQGGCSAVYVVVAAPHAARIRTAMPTEQSFILNPAPERGMSSSLQQALKLPEIAAQDAMLMALVDHPRVATQTVVDLIACWDEGRQQPRPPMVVRPRHAGTTGHPIIIDRRLFSRIGAATPGADLRAMLRANAADMATGDQAVLDDWDHRETIAAAGALPPCP